MKFLLMIYDVDFDEEVAAFLSVYCTNGYTKWDRVLGKGKKSDPRLDDAIWPGFNCAVAIGIEDEEYEKTVMEGIKKLLDKLHDSGIKIFELPLLRVI